MFVSLLSSVLKNDHGGEIVTLSLANLFRIISVIGAGCVAAAYIIVGNRLLSMFKAPFVFFLLYAIIAIVSAGYASHGFYALWKSLEIFIGVLSVATVLTHKGGKEALMGAYRVTKKFFIFLLLSVVAGAFLFPDQAFTSARGILSIQLKGVMVPLNPNTLAFVSAFCGLFSFVKIVNGRIEKARVFHYVLFVASLATLILAQSRTSLIAFVVAVLCFLFFCRRYKLLITVMIMAIVLLSLQTLREGTFGYVRRGQNAELAMSLSGRTIAWEMAYKQFLKSPYMGSGFASAGRFDVLRGGAMSSLHGSIFDVLVGVGLFGAIPWIMGVFWTSIRLVWPKGRMSMRTRSPIEIIFRAELIAVAALILIRSITSSDLALHGATLLLFLLLVAFASEPEKTVNNSTPGEV